MFNNFHKKYQRAFIEIVAIGNKWITKSITNGANEIFSAKNDNRSERCLSVSDFVLDVSQIVKYERDVTHANAMQAIGTTTSTQCCVDWNSNLYYSHVSGITTNERV